MRFMIKHKVEITYNELLFTCDKQIVFCVLCIILILWLNMGLAENAIRSSSLHKVTTKKDNIERIDYVNDEGKLTYAANKHYATIIKTRKEKSVLEEFYDEEGNPAKQEYDYYKVLKEYNDEGLEYRITYLDIDGKKMMLRTGYCIIVRSFNQNKQIIKESYYDTSEKPVMTNSFGYGCYREYDDEGNNNVITYFDENGMPMVCGQGFATVRRTFYTSGVNKGKAQYTFYYDKDNQPIQLGIGQYGVLRDYDEFGRTTQISYLDSSGQLIKTKEGYSSIKCTYYEDDSIMTENYYDADGKPVMLSEGQYGIMNKHNKKLYLDQNGNEIFNLRNSLYNSQTMVCISGVFIIILSSVLNRRLNSILLIMYLGFIVYMSLMNRNASGYGLQLELFWSYRRFFIDKEIMLEILNNIWLFVPLGVILYCLVPKKIIVIFPVLLAFLIEFIQYWMKLGLCELDDVISNGLGGMLGYFVAAFIKIKKRMRSTV